MELGVDITYSKTSICSVKASPTGKVALGHTFEAGQLELIAAKAVVIVFMQVKQKISYKL